MSIRHLPNCHHGKPEHVDQGGTLRCRCVCACPRPGPILTDSESAVMTAATRAAIGSDMPLGPWKEGMYWLGKKDGREVLWWIVRDKQGRREYVDLVALDILLVRP
jgi:hypothetical protein